MQEHDYTITHREGKHHQNADALSRRKSKKTEEVQQINLEQNIQGDHLSIRQDADQDLAILK